MTDKQIIVDGVDVSEWTDEEARYKFEKHSPKAIRQIAFDLYKQLKSKEQECEELKEQIKKYSNINEQDTKDFAILHNSFIEIEGLIKNFCEDCSEYERCDYEKDGCYYSILPRLKDIIKKVKESK